MAPIFDRNARVFACCQAEIEAAKERERQAQLNSGVPLCEKGSGVLGDSGRTGVLTAKACTRIRDGTIETGPRTGALLFF